jgi:tetratricopeptide (TPR) repeat protein
MKFFIFLFTSLLIISGCKTKEKPLTHEEVKQFAKDLEISMEKRDGSFFNEAIDKKELIKRSGISDNKSGKGFASGMQQGMDLGTKLVNSFTKGATYKIVKQYEKDNIHHVIFRLYDDGSLNYHDLELKRTGSEVKVADMFIYTGGEKFSETIKSLYDQFSGLIDKTTGKEDWIKSMPKIRGLITKGEYQEAYDLFNTLPPEAKTSKPFRIIYIEICSGLGDEMHKKALDDFQAAFPNEPNMQLVLIDAYFLNKEYDKALNAVNAVDKMIDKDPFLDYYRYLCYNIMDNQEKAKEHLLKVIKYDPDFEGAQLELIATYLEEGNNKAAKPLIEAFQKKKSYEQETLNTVLTMYPDWDE